MEIQLGKFNQLKIVKEVDFGQYLDGGELGEILLPQRYVLSESKIGDIIDVFLYLDSEERIIATTKTPFVQVGQYAYLEVVWINEYGAFLDWGLMKDLFVPYGEQKVKMEKGKKYIVYTYIDDATYRIVASSKIDSFLIRPTATDLLQEEQVDLLIWEKTDLGYKVIINNLYGGLIYDNEIFQSINIGMELSGYIQQIRPDGKVDVALQPTGKKNIIEFSDILLEKLQGSKDGFLAYHDKSPAEDIYNEFMVSKKTFKKAIGDLYKKRLITLHSNGIQLVKK
ncbi:MAG: GntR family transcriptional regulator [Bacteroidales bacterium]|nr:GntR family transcriptional regulator [Bacteroidales bacterium]